jgi:hypothetical protein
VSKVGETPNAVLAAESPDACTRAQGFGAQARATDPDAVPGGNSYCGNRRGTSFSIRNSPPHSSQIARLIRIVSIGDSTTVSFPQYGHVTGRSSTGTLVTLDNSRVFAAGQAGTNVKAAVHDAADTISPERGQAFLEQYGSRPSTWGDAAQLRIQNQSAGFRNTYPNGSPYTGVK